MYLIIQLLNVYTFVHRFSILVSIIAIIVLQNVLPNLSDLEQNTSSLNTFINNILGYCLILVPGFWLYKFAKQQDLSGKVVCFNFIQSLKNTFQKAFIFNYY